MKDINLLVWLSQLGLSIAVPLGGFILLGVWLHQSCGWGVWTVWTGVIIGLVCAADGLRSSLRIMKKMSSDKQDQQPVSYNDHD